MTGASSAGPSQTTGDKEYSYGGKKLSPKVYYEKLLELKRKKLAAWWAMFNVLLVGNEVKLQCLKCDKTFSASNPSMVAPNHFKQHEAETAAPAGTPKAANVPTPPPNEPTTDEPSGSRKRPRAEEGSSIRSFIAAAGQTSIFLTNLALFFFKCDIALHLIEHPNLVKACAAFGIKLPSRWVLGTKMLDEAYSEVSSRMDRECAKDGGLAAIATDGWKNRLAFLGSPLINVMKLLSFRSLFVHVVNASGNIKSSQWIRDLHIKLVSKVFKQSDDCIGFVMDNVKANRSAMKLLRDHNPRWLTVGCVAHGLSLLFKDFGNSKKCPWFSKVVEAALMISNTINNSERIRSALHREQEAKLGRACAVTVNNPTRFGGQYFLVRLLAGQNEDE